MKFGDIIRRAGRSLLQAKARTLLTSLAIAVGAFTLTLSLAAGEGSREYANKLVTSNIDPQTLLIAKDKGLFGGGGAALNSGLKKYTTSTTQLGGATYKALDSADIAKIKATKNVEDVVPSYSVNAQYVTFQGGAQKYTSEITVYDASIRGDTAAGSLPSLGVQLSDNDIVVPQAYFQTLGINNIQSFIGKKVTLHLVKSQQTPTAEQIQGALASGGSAAVAALTQVQTRDVSYTVSAISKTSSTSLSASSGLFISQNQARELSDFLTQGTPNYQKYVTVSAKAKEGTDPEVAKNALVKLGYVARTAHDLQSILFTIVDVLQGIVIGFGVLALIASVFGIINTQYISVLERTQQIGLMKALGMRRKDVSRLFRYEAAWIGFLGGVIGSGLAITAGTALNPVISKQLMLDKSDHLLIFQPLPIAGLIIALMLIAIVAGYLPARKAAKLDPIEALRTE